VHCVKRNTQHCTEYKINPEKSGYLFASFAAFRKKQNPITVMGALGRDTDISILKNKRGQRIKKGLNFR
jgi:hypothetical protein